MRKLKIPAHVKAAITQGQKDIKEGRWYTNKQVEDEILLMLIEQRKPDATIPVSKTYKVLRKKK